MRTVEWHQNKVRMIDQRQLPLEFAIVEFKDYLEVGRSIKEMYVRGAPAIGATAAYGLALGAQQSEATEPQTLLADLETIADELRATRPTAVNLSWALDRMLAQARALAEKNASPDEIRKEMVRNAKLLADQDVAINQRMGAHGAALIQDGDNILTHCNAGSLATVDYGTVLGVIRTAWKQGKQIHVWVDETRPRLQGARLTTWELMRDGIPCTLIADNAAGHLMRSGQVNIVLFGADRVAANGDVANKIGSYKLAVVARENGIPCYSVSPTSTVDLSLPTGDDIPIEERNRREVTHCFGQQVAPDDVPVYNPAFDVTPHRYLTGIVTENGVVYPPFALTLKQAVQA